MLSTLQFSVSIWMLLMCFVEKFHLIQCRVANCQSNCNQAPVGHPFCHNRHNRALFMIPPKPVAVIHCVCDLISQVQHWKVLTIIHWWQYIAGLASPLRPEHTILASPCRPKLRCQCLAYMRQGWLLASPLLGRRNWPVNSPSPSVLTMSKPWNW